MLLIFNKYLMVVFWFLTYSSHLSYRTDKKGDLCPNKYIPRDFYWPAHKKTMGRLSKMTVRGNPIYNSLEKSTTVFTRLLTNKNLPVVFSLSNSQIAHLAI